MSNQVVKQQTIAAFLNRQNTREYLESILRERTGQFITSLVSMTNLTPQLAACDPKTLLSCGLKATSMNLPLDNNLGFAYAIPYNNKKTGVTEAQFQLGYRAFVQLAQRSGQYKTINVIDIRRGEFISWDTLTEELKLEPINDPVKREAQPVVGYAGVFVLQNGFRKTTYWTRERAEKHAKRFSKTFASGPWQTDFDSMAKKVVLKDLLSKWGPLTTEMQEAITYDQAVIREENGQEVPDYVDAEFTREPLEGSLTDDFEKGQADGTSIK